MMEETTGNILTFAIIFGYLFINLVQILSKELVKMFEKKDE